MDTALIAGGINMRIEHIGDRYAVIRMSDEFTTFLDPIPETRKIAKSIMNTTDDTVERLRLITEWVHDNIEYDPDWLDYGKPDYFASPRETLKRRRGDCEDMAFLICSIANALKPKPTPVYVTVGYYTGMGTPLSYHAWAYCGGAICEGTAGFITNKEDNRYHPLFGIYRDHISIFKPVSYFVDRSGGFLNINIGDVIGNPVIAYMAASVAAPLVAKGVEKGIELLEKKKR